VVSQVKSLLQTVPVAPAVTPDTDGKKEDKRGIETKPVPEEESLDSSEPEIVKDENLDPPRGMGLKFDEIEKMIDQVLASEP